ncbi:uncharacterized protein LOC119063475 [Artibeus jamaicensis]|uniref:uncharacterized protein LOC119063475 n=1 Tax=Artibeus jamaicensis TaxID=9417 RepID=UPI00235ACE82|nr:uncharacterized protein LOC119063475 [Artibeus jamaicensis]
MIRKALVLSTWFILAGALPLTLPHITDDADIFSDSKLEAELKPIADPESTTDFKPTEVVELILDLGRTRTVLSPTFLDSTDTLKLNTGLPFTGAEVPAANRDPADALELNTSLHLDGSAVPPNDLNSTSVEVTINLLPLGAVQWITDVDLETTRVLKLFTDVESNITSFLEETTNGATASGTGDNLEEPVTGELEEPNTSRVGDEFIPKLT